MIERASRLIVIVSVGTALAILTTQAARAWPQLQVLTAVAFFGAACVAVAFDAVAVGIVLLFAYVFPAAVAIGHGRYLAEHGVIWMAALLGALAPRAVHSGWGVPPRWRPALILWALTIALAWPLIVMREIDFYPPMLARMSPVAVVWILNVAAILGLGILWFDWLFTAIGADKERFDRFVLLPLALSCGVASAVAAYQVLGDIHFLNRGLFGHFGRASGTMLDGNAFGTVAALGTAGVLAWALEGTRQRWWLAMPLVTLGWIAVWGSGSRTAVVAGGIPLLVVVWLALRGHSPGQSIPRKQLIGTAAAVVVLVALVASLDVSVVGPVRRLTNLLPGRSLHSAQVFLREMWTRNGYGSAAAAMVLEHPLVGVGVGSFQVLVPEYSKAAGVRPLPPDNAQNWFRHQLAEFGVLGSVGWIAWVALFGVFLTTAPVPADRRPAADVLRAALVAFALISLVGMPAQNAAVAFTFWTIAFWFATAADTTRTSAFRPRTTRLIEAGSAALLILFLAGTAFAARHDLRPAERALANGLPYEYGFARPEMGPGGLTYRWAAKRAVVALDAPRPWMRLVVSVNHFDIGTNPVRVRIWCDEALALETTLNSVAPITKYVQLPTGRPRVLLQTWVSRVVRPRDLGLPDNRELGLFVHWDFVDRPPSGAATITVSPP
ncbi:MAG: O-antigen ligase family protein [Betaproteobacteria bacterium]